MSKIEINQQVATDFSDEFYRHIVLDTLKKLEIDDVEVSIGIIGDEEIKKINKTYRNKDEVTDVLSFEDGGSDKDKRYLGEILIAYKFVKERAKINGGDLAEDLGLMLRHGLMHLLGYNHQQMKELSFKAI